MPTQTRIVSPGPAARCVRTAEGAVLHPPTDWRLVAPGDAALTRRLKAGGPTWTVQERRGRKVFSQGVWAPGTVIDQVISQLAGERATPEYAQQRQTQARRRDREQAQYVQSFRQAVLEFLAFGPRHAALASQLAQSVADHATPVGSGTVARTQRIPVPQRAQAAVIAWMRHRTTHYERMVIPRVKGKRREVRRELARQCQVLLDAYRADRVVDPTTCPLHRALSRGTPVPGKSSSTSVPAPSAV